MSLSCVEELHWVVRVIDDFLESLKIGEEEVSSLVSRETTSETDDEGVRVDGVDSRVDVRWRALVLCPLLLSLSLHIVDELLLQSLSDVPDFLVWHVLYLLEDREVRLVVDVFLAESLLVECLPL